METYIPAQVDLRFSRYLHGEDYLPYHTPSFDFNDVDLSFFESNLSWWFFKSHPPSLGERRIRGMKNWIAAHFLMQIYRRVHTEKKNFIGVITGDPGSGKSFSAIQMARMLDPYFTHENIVYTPQQFFTRLATINRVGTAIVWDEAGVGIPAREWQGIVNRAIGKTLQIFRQTKAGRLFLLFVTPDLSYIDKQARKLLNFFSIAKRPAGKNTELRVYRVEVDRFDRTSDSMRYKVPKFSVTSPTGKRIFVILRSFRIPLLPQAWQEAYHRVSQETKEDLVEQYIEFVGKEEADKLRKKRSAKQRMDEFVEYVRSHIDECIDNNGKLSVDLIMFALRDRGIKQQEARTVKKVLEKEMGEYLQMVAMEAKIKKKKSKKKVVKL